MKVDWSPTQREALEAIESLAEMEMLQAYDICENCTDKFVMAKTYHYVYKKGKDKDIPRQFRAMAARENREVWTPELTEEAIRIAQEGIQCKMDYVRVHFARTFDDDIETYGFRGCTGSAGVVLIVALGGLLLR